MAAEPTLARVHRGLRRRFGIDVRALAAFRMGLASLLLVDLLLRARRLGMFYTDDGVLPVSVLAEQYPRAVWLSVHTLSGALWYQALLFLVAGVCAVALLVGYRTRLVTLLSLYLLLSLHIRNPHVISGADALLQHLLFWSLFLPLGACWSVDARRTATDDGRVSASERFLSLGTVGILSQVLVVYGVNAVLKLRSDQWLSGNAVEYILGIERYTVLLGPTLAEVPILLLVVNWLWVGLLVVSPGLVVLTGRVRTVLVGLFMLMHLGMVLTLQLGLFPFVSVLALLLFLPAGVWDRPETPTRSRPRRVCSRLLIRLDDIIPTTDFGRSGPSREWLQTAGRAVGATALVVILVFNATAVGLLAVPGPAEDTLSGDPSDSRWSLFAPEPPETGLWYVAPGESPSGERVDALHGTDIQWENPDREVEQLPSARTRKYVSNVYEHDRLREPFAIYLCERWERTHGEQLGSVSVYVVDGPGDTGGEPTRTKLVAVACPAVDSR